VYTLTLTEQDMETISFVGGRYSWSAALGDLEEGQNEISEAEAWEIIEKFGQDDTVFPMLNFRSDLFNKLVEFWDSVV
jgi:hypothetical protein